MMTVVINSKEEFDAAIAAAKERGMHLACMSNTGIVGTGYQRLTFLPESAFTDYTAEARERLDDFHN